jgi:ABC-2 type transport system permease protein
MVQLPAVWVLVGVALALFGLAPRFAPASWGVLVGCLLLGQLGRLLQLPSWAIAVSPFTYVPRLPGDTVDAAPLLALLGIASVLGAAGVFGLRRRDVR